MSILTVIDYKEVTPGVLEFEIGGRTITSAVLSGNVDEPVVEMPCFVEGRESNVKFLIRRGSTVDVFIDLSSINE